MDADFDDLNASAPPTPRTGGRSLPPVRPAEQLLVDLAAELPPILASSEGQPPRILCTTQGAATLGRALAQADSQAAVHCHYFDQYHLERAQAIEGLPANLTLACAADLPPDDVDQAAFPWTAAGEAEFVRDVLQAARQRLRPGGRLLASTDNPRDAWLEGELRKLFDRVDRRASAAGAAYVATSDRPLKKVKNFSHEFVFRDRERLIRAFSRPGVFSHRRVDPGARQLLERMEISAGDRVLDLGCGSGVLSLAAAGRAEGVRVLAVDSSARAVECTREGAARNGLTNVQAERNASGNLPGVGTFQRALANPPYYANFRIARHFLATAHAALAPGGTILLVTKQPEWYAENMGEWFEDLSAEASKSYYVVGGWKR